MLQTSTLGFLKQLAKNNNKEWFDANRNKYEGAREDHIQSVQNIIDALSKTDATLASIDAKKCMFRINRDIRFSKDKSPYKTNLGASMDKEGKKSGKAGYYFHLEPGKSFLGGGLWQPDPDKLKKVRQEIDYCFDEFKKIVSLKKFKTLYGDLYTGDGIQLSKVPQGFEKDNPASEYLKFKSWLVITDIKDADLTSKDLVSKTVAAFGIMQPFVKFLNRPLE